MKPAAFPRAGVLPPLIPARVRPPQVRWFEHVKDIDPSMSEARYEREILELEDVDVNPVGCLAAKAVVFYARSFEEVSYGPHATN